MIQGFLTRPAPRMPSRNSYRARSYRSAASASAHAIALVVLLAIVPRGAVPVSSTASSPGTSAPLQTPRIVFLSAGPPGGGGGGGGNRQRAPARRAERPGRDRLTLPAARPMSTLGRIVDVPAPVQQIVLDARPTASGMIEQIGTPEGGVGIGTSLGPGTGGGVGDGIGSGIGSGRGPGFGPGSGGGIGGGVYRPGGAVTPPRVLQEVKPVYTTDALRLKIQGLVVLELIVRTDGRPGNIRIVRSLDGRDLDQEAIRAVQQWRFEPGRLGETPVDVLVIVELQFSIR